MISDSKSTLSINNLKTLRPKVTQYLCVRSFVNPHPELLSLLNFTTFLTLSAQGRQDRTILQIQTTLVIREHFSANLLSLLKGKIPPRLGVFHKWRHCLFWERGDQKQLRPCFTILLNIKNYVILKSVLHIKNIIRCQLKICNFVP